MDKHKCLTQEAPTHLLTAAEDRLSDEPEPRQLSSEASACLPRKGQVSTQSTTPRPALCECGECSGGGPRSVHGAPSEGPCSGGGSWRTRTGGEDEEPLPVVPAGRHRRRGSSRLGKAQWASVPRSYSCGLPWEPGGS